ncbi:MAG: hypothetical protein IT464_00935 [Planctomycetes bacterium]|nr:hypothetical protein [Planctomycetota bacterium]
MHRLMLLMFSLVGVLALASCGGRTVIDEKTRETNRLEMTGAYEVTELQVSFKPLQDWEITDEEWRLWVAGWRVDYQKEMNSECYKDIKHIKDASEATKAYVECDIYEMDKGGSFGVGGAGFARANVKITDAKTGEVLYEGKLEGKGSSGVFETATAQGRFKFSVLNLARQISDLLETGTTRDPE